MKRRRLSVILAALLMALLSVGPAIAATVTESEPNDGRATADVLKGHTSGSMLAKYDPETDYDYFSIRLAPGDTLSLTIAARNGYTCSSPSGATDPTAVNTHMQLRAPQKQGGAEVASDESQGCATISHTATHRGVYHVRVTSLYNAYGMGGGTWDHVFDYQLDWTKS